MRVGEQVFVEPFGEPTGALGEGVAEGADVFGVGLGDSQERLAAAAFRLVHPVALQKRHVRPRREVPTYRRSTPAACRHGVVVDLHCVAVGPFVQGWGGRTPSDFLAAGPSGGRLFAKPAPTNRRGCPRGGAAWKFPRLLPANAATGRRRTVAERDDCANPHTSGPFEHGTARGKDGRKCRPTDDPTSACRPTAEPSAVRHEGPSSPSRLRTSTAAAGPAPGRRL